MSPPNVVLFNPDQWRGDTLGHVGHPAVPTPNLDERVRTDAVSFASAFCQNTVCTPSRCSFMTGWYPHVRGHRTMYHMLHKERGEPNMMQVLKENGYYVWWGGKNDLVPGQFDVAHVCDERFKPDADLMARWGVRVRERSHGGDMAWRGAPDGDNYFSFFKGKLDKGEDPFFGDPDWQEVLGAIEFLRDYDGDKPFLLNLSLSFPHPPYGVEEPWYSLTDRARLPRRARAPREWAGKPSILEGICKGQRMQSWSEERWAELRAVYCGMCARLDHQFGMLVEALRAAGRYEDTAIFFFSDHGDFTGDYGLVEKTQNTFEDCLSRVPFIVKPPRDRPVQPRVSDALVELIDVSATVYDLAGIEPGYDHFGQSLCPVIAGTTDEHRDAVFCEGGRRIGECQAMERESSSAGNADGLYSPRLSLQTTDDGPYHGKAAMCRTRDFKYVHRLYETDELYDLIADPLEENNVVAAPEHEANLARMKERLLRWYMETADVVPFQTDKRGG